MDILATIRGLSRRKKIAVILFVDSLLVVVSLGAAMALPAREVHPLVSMSQHWQLFPVMVLVGVFTSLAMGIPRTKLKAYETRAIAQTGAFALALSLSFGAIKAMGAFFSMNGPLANGMPAEVFIVFGLLFFALSVAARISGLQVLLWVYRQGGVRMRILIYGAGATGVQLAVALGQSKALELRGFVDDNKTLQGMTVAGLPVRSPVDLPRILHQLGIERVVLAMPSLPRARQAQIARRLQAMGCAVEVLPSFSQLVGGKRIDRKLELFPVSSYLERDLIDQEFPEYTHSYADKSVLITGAGGSIGSELCRQIIACNPARLILFDQSEPALYAIDLELRTLLENKTVDLVPVVGSVCNRAQVDALLAREGVDVILHAAAHKHVPLVEGNEVEGLRNNVLGTKILADAAIAAGVKRFVLISSDKAVRPTSVMGASKRLAEIVVQDLASRCTVPLFSTVRFGNVLGSSGSVIPLFQEQILRGGPVTLTHHDVTRYFMTASEAARLVLVAGSLSCCGDIFVLDMGQPVHIRRLARRMIENSGYSVRDENRPDGDIEIVVTGLRPGEKLYEELLIGAETQTTPHPKILRAKEECLSEIEVATMLRDLRSVVETQDSRAARTLISRWVAERKTTDRYDEAL